MLFSLQAMRALGAGMVFLFHASLLQYGYVGVDVFFVLSGFIIFYVHHKDFPKNLCGLNHAKKDSFFVYFPIQFAQLLQYSYRRFIRIYPTYWLFCAFFLWGIWVRGGKLSDFYAFNWWAFMQTFWLTPLHPTFLVVSWTLSYELYFYVLVGLLFVQIGRINIGFWVMCIVFLGSFTNFLNSFFLVKIVDFEKNEFLTFFFNDILLEFYLGIFIFYLTKKNPQNFLLQISLKKYLFLTPFFLLINIFLVYVCSRSRELYGGLPAFWAILGLVLWETESNLIEKNICNWFFQQYFLGKILVRLGGASYLLYISHSLLMGTLTNIWKKIPFVYDINNSFNDIFRVNVLYVLQIILIQIIVLYISEWIEQPFLRKIKT